MLDREHPEQAQVQLQAPAINTVRLAGSYLVVTQRPARREP
jgi:hypothetical protein